VQHGAKESLVFGLTSVLGEGVGCWVLARCFCCLLLELLLVLSDPATSLLVWFWWFKFQNVKSARHKQFSL
jgi:hypothetical protein